MPEAGRPHAIFLDRLYFFAGYAAGAFLVLIFLIMLGMSAGRQVELNIPAGDDFTSWCMAAMSFLGLAHTFKKGEMIRVGILLEYLTGKKRWAVEIFSLTVATAFTVYFAWYAVVDDLRFLPLQRHGAGRRRGAAVDPAARLQRRPGHPAPSR